MVIALVDRVLPAVCFVLLAHIARADRQYHSVLKTQSAILPVFKLNLRVFLVLTGLFASMGRCLPAAQQECTA
jgi:hypothetical protein